MARRPGPERTCVGCRKRASKTEFVRVVVFWDDLVPDVHGRLPGRGAHIHLDPGCLDLAERRGAFPRALHTPGPLALAPLRRLLDEEPVSQKGPQGMSCKGNEQPGKSRVRAASDADVESRSSDAMSAR